MSSDPDVSIPTTSTFSTPTMNQTPTTPQKRRRLSCLTWNAGKLTPSDWDHFQQWLMCQALGMLSPFRRRIGHTQRPGHRSHYHCVHLVHSGYVSGQAGALTVISKKLCGIDDISWDEIDRGRILHVRVFGKQRNIDILNVYQHVRTETTSGTNARCFLQVAQTQSMATHGRPQHFPAEMWTFHRIA